jgi:hypothetical protein
MKVQLSQDIKLFVTTNLDTLGVVNPSGFTNNNTWQILPTTQGITLEQEKSYEYISEASFIDSQSTKDTVTSGSISTGTLSFSVALNSSKSGPSDLQLWNSLTNQFRYPGTQWQTDSFSRTMTLARNSRNLSNLGFLIAYKDILYKVNSVKVLSAQISAPLSELASTTWTLNFNSYETVSGVKITPTTSGYTFTGTFTGTAAGQDASKYVWAPGKFAQVDVYDSAEVHQGALAALNLNVSINNTLEYLPGVFFDRTTTTPVFAAANSFEVSGDLECYVRGPGSYVYGVLKELENTRALSSASTSYRFKLSIYSSGNNKVCEIYMGPCVLTNSLDASEVLVGSINFKMIKDTSTEKSFVKFYT